MEKKKKEASELIEAYVAALRKLAKMCNFDKLEERLIRDQVIIGVRQQSLRENFLEDKGLTLDKCLSVGRALEVPNSSYSQCQMKENHFKCNACSTRRNKVATSTQVLPQSKEGEEMKIHQENAQDVENIHHIVGKNVQQRCWMQKVQQERPLCSNVQNKDCNQISRRWRWQCFWHSDRRTDDAWCSELACWCSGDYHNS